jgi:hypothetical protein
VNTSGHGGQHDVVDGPTEIALDRPEHLERPIRRREPPIRTDLSIERAMRWRAHARDGAKRVRGGGCGLRQDPRLPCHVVEALERVENHLLHGVTDQILEPGGGLG